MKALHAEEAGGGASPAMLDFSLRKPTTERLFWVKV
jgi:hypothetical protein